MKIIYTDGSYCWKNNIRKIGKIAYKIGNKKVQVKEIEMPEVENLKQYSNLFELKAIIEALKETKAKKVLLFTDSQVVYWWVKRRENDLGRISQLHYELKNQVDKLQDKIKFEIRWIPRDKNLAGIFLENL